MNKYVFQTSFFLMLFVPELAGQARFPLKLKESVNLLTDRNLYISGEKILFSAFTSVSGGGNTGEMLSTILYCELINPEGKQVSGGKFSIENSQSSGSLDIPPELLTGNYYLRGYTRFMRNEGPGAFSYSYIKIINPYRNEVQVSNKGKIPSDSLYVQKIEETDGISVSTDRRRYSARDSILISVGNNESFKRLTISVVPQFSITDAPVITPGKQVPEKNYFYPETRGVTITGTVRDEKNGNILSGVRVNLSILGKGRDFMAMKTDTAGLFFFSIPGYTGSRDLFLCTEKADSLNPGIFIDNDFCSLPAEMPAGAFELSQEEREIGYKMAVNFQLASYFNKSSTSQKMKDEQQWDQSFYGKPDEVLDMDAYVQLPTLEEYLNGLPVSLKVRKRLGHKYFKIIGPQTGLSEFDPLVLVDLVAIDDPAKILSVNPRNFLRIELVNALYVKGDQIYGGIVNFISRKNDFAGIDLPSSGVFLNYGFLNDTTGNSSPQLKAIHGNHIPDTRNTIFWEPHFQSGKSSMISITAPDTPGKYIIVINVINDQDSIFRKTIQFEVVR